MAQGLSNADGIARRNRYGTYGTPTAWFDGLDYVTGPVDAYRNYQARIDEHLAVDSPVTVDASAEFGTSEVAVTIEVALEPGQSLPDDVSQYAVRAIVYEVQVTYCCDTVGGDTFHHIGRVISAGQPLVITGPGRRAAPVVETILLDPAWGDDLVAVAFVEHVSGAILHASGPAGTTAVNAHSWGRLKSLYRR